MPKSKSSQKVVKQSFIQGALILTLSLAIVKAVGALFKIPLANIISENGMGYFGTAYNLYAVLYSLATAGFPVAIARLIAENQALGNYNQMRQVKRVALPIFLVTGTVGTLLMILGAIPYTRYVQNEGAVYSIVCLAPSIFFCCLGSIYKGYFEGVSNMTPTAVCEVIEALCKFVFGLSGALLTVRYFSNEFNTYGTFLGAEVTSQTAILRTYQFAAAAAILGVTIGTFFSWIYGWIYYHRRGTQITEEMYQQSPPAESGKIVAKKLIKVAVPIAVGSLVSSFAGLVDSSFLLRRLGEVVENNSQLILSMYNGSIPAENLSDLSTIPNFLYGCYNNGLTIFMLVPTVTTAFGVSALPALASSWAKGDKEDIKKSIETIMRMTSIVTIPCGLGITFLAKPIAYLLYGSTGAADIVGRCLVVLGIGSIFSALSTPITSMLQAVDRADLPVKLVVIGLVIKIAVNYTLCGIPIINVQGAGLGSLFCYLFLTIVEVIALKRITGVKLSMSHTFLRPTLSALIACGFAWGVNFLMVTIGVSARISCCVAIVAAVVIYIPAVILLRAIPKDDMLMMPKGEKIVNTLEKHGWIR